MIRVRRILALCAALSIASAAAANEPQPAAHGYALLHDTLGKLERLPAVLYVKLESDALDELATRLGEHAAEARADIASYAESHPAIALDATGLPEADVARRTRTRNALLAELALSSSSSEFERLYLLALMNIANQSRHTAAAVADMAPDDAGAELAGTIAERFDADYRAVRELLAREHFRAEGSE